MSRIDLDHLRVFCAVVKAGNFTAAAEALHISQPSISRTIDILESRLGFRLFTRTPRGIKLTPYGERLSRQAIYLIEQIEMEIKLLTDVSAEPQGELKIVTTPHMAGSWLIQCIPKFLKQYPKLTLDIHGTMGAIDLKECDAIIRTEIPHHPGLVQHHVLSLHMGLFASKEYLKEHGTPKNAAELDKHRLVTFADNIIHPYGNCSWILTVGNKTSAGRKPYLKVDSIEGLINAAKCGIGIVELSSDWMSVREAGLVPVLPQLKGPEVKLYYIYPEKMEKSPRVTALAKFLESEYKKSIS